MKKIIFLLAALLTTACAIAQQNPRVTTKNGVLEGTYQSGLNVFLGVPFAQPPVGDLRWVEPQPVKNWEGVRQAKEFGPNPMQTNVFGDMAFNTKKMSEDCLYLNIWSPAKSAADKLPVFIYFNGGGLIAGSGSEPRYAGDIMAHEGIVCITANYREGIFGFYSNPELSSETSYKGSGNYGHMDQAAAIKWVKDNIAAFGGDPDHITIMGESAGSGSVSALMASPMSKGLIAQAMGSSGSVLVAKNIMKLSDAEKAGVETMKKMGCKSIKEMRALSAEELLKRSQGGIHWGNVVDGRFFTESPVEVYRKGQQAQVPLLVGGNNLEFPVMWRMQGKPATRAALKEMAKAYYGDRTDEVMAAFGINNDADANSTPGNNLSAAMFIDYSTWKWSEMQRATSSKPVYRYRFTHPRPDMRENKEAMLAGGTRESATKAPLLPGAVHSADIEYEMGTLPTNRVYDWTPCCYNTSKVFLKYYANFIKTGNPNGLGLPEWKPCNGQAVPGVLMLDENSYMSSEANIDNAYRVIDQILGK